MWYSSFKKKKSNIYLSQFSSVQSLSHVRLFATPWTAARQAFPSITNSRSLLKLMSIESMMPSNHLILHRPLLIPSPVDELFSYNTSLNSNNTLRKVLLPCLQVRTLRLRLSNWIAQENTASKWQSLDCSSDFLTPKPSLSLRGIHEKENRYFPWPHRAYSLIGAQK